MDSITTEEEAINHILFELKQKAKNRIQLALKWAKEYNISNSKVEYNSRQIAALVFLYESIQQFPSWKIGETLYEMDTAENNYLISWINDTFYFGKKDIYEAFVTWKKDRARLGCYIAYGMNTIYEIMQEAASKGDVELLEWLLSRNVEIDFKDSSGRTALHIAALEGHLATVNFLLERGASRFVLDSECRSPFILAFEGEHFKICDILRPVSFENIKIDSIIQEFSPHKLQYLLRNRKGNFIWNALEVAVESGYSLIVDTLLYHCPPFVHAPKEYKKTLLKKSFIKGNRNIIEKLLAVGLEVDDSLVNFAKENKMSELLSLLNPSIDTVD